MVDEFSFCLYEHTWRLHLKAGWRLYKNGHWWCNSKVFFNDKTWQNHIPIKKTRQFITDRWINAQWWKTHLIEGKCLMTTSKAWTVSKGTLGSRPDSASCRACRLTQDTHLIDTLKLRSLPSPGMVTSSSTCVVDGQKKKETEAMPWCFKT